MRLRIPKEWESPNDVIDQSAKTGSAARIYTIYGKRYLETYKKIYIHLGIKNTLTCKKRVEFHFNPATMERQMLMSENSICCAKTSCQTLEPRACALGFLLSDLGLHCLCVATCQPRAKAIMAQLWDNTVRRYQRDGSQEKSNKTSFFSSNGVLQV